jgi:hypothetical protein
MDKKLKCQNLGIVVDNIRLLLSISIFFGVIDSGSA